MTDTVVYVYAVGDAGLAGSDQLAALTGVSDAPVRAVVAGELAAAVSSVDAAGFSEESLRRCFEDLHWLAETARAHHSVIDALAERQPVAPLRLATVYLDDDNVVALLDEQRAGLCSALDRIRGRSEWGLKAFVGERRTTSDGEAEPPTEGTRPGTSYLLRRRAEREQARRGQEEATDAAEQLHRRVAEFAVASRRYPPQDPRLSGFHDEMVLNAAYLVDDAGAAALQHEIDGWDQAVLRLMLTGPWAPYSFATLEEP